MKCSLCGKEMWEVSKIENGEYVNGLRCRGDEPIHHDYTYWENEPKPGFVDLHEEFSKKE